MTRPFLLAQISDLHITAPGTRLLGRVDTAAMLSACVESVLRLEQRPDAIAITGDLTDHGRPEEYAQLRELLAPLPMPLYLLPGNHDERAALRETFPEHAYLAQSPQFIQYAIDEWPLRVVAVDTLAGMSDGELCADRLAWLEQTLAAAPTRDTAVLMHHPPFATFINGMDRCALRNPDAFADVIRRHPQVLAVFCGHVHRPVETRFAGTRASIAPSCAHHIVLDLESDRKLRYVMEPPAFRLHAYSPAAGLVSHTAYVGEFSAPHAL